MKKLFTLTAENGDKLKIRVERNDDLSWSIDEIAPAFGCKPDMEERPENYLIDEKLFERLSKPGAFWKAMRLMGQIPSKESPDAFPECICNASHRVDYCPIHGKQLHSKHKFNKGDWCYHVKDNYFFRVIGIGETMVISDSFLSINSADCRHATTGEIIKFLRTVAEVQYVGKCVNGLEWKCAGVITSFREYNRVTDTLYYNSGDVSIAVYRQGEWAEIVPISGIRSDFYKTMRLWAESLSSKKKLPKTKAEFREFYKLFTGTSHDITMADFLEDYED